MVRHLIMTIINLGQSWDGQVCEKANIRHAKNFTSRKLNNIVNVELRQPIGETSHVKGTLRESS